MPVRGVPGPGGSAWSRGECLLPGWSGPGGGGLVPGVVSAPGGVSALGGGGGIPACTEADPPTREQCMLEDTGNKRAAMHPSGMHFCFVLNSL